MLSKYSFVLLILCVVLVNGCAHGPKDNIYDELPQLKINNSNITVSGVSAGAYMASQMQVACSGIFSGVGVVSGGFYGCAEKGLSVALKQCMPGVGLDNLYEGALKLTNNLSEDKSIDDVKNLKNINVAIVYGDSDKVVNPLSSIYVKRYFNEFNESGGTNIVSIKGMQHGSSAPKAPLACGKLASPYVYNCDFDTAKYVLKKLYKNVKYSDPDKKNLYLFDQHAVYDISSVDDYGYIYIPSQCYSGECKLHIVLHGCKQGKEFIGDEFVSSSGFLEYADNAGIVIVFPQNKSEKLNPAGCWDWWGYSSNEFYTKDAPQVKFIKSIVNKLQGK